MLTAGTVYQLSQQNGRKISKLHQSILILIEYIQTAMYNSVASVGSCTQQSYIFLH